MKRNCTSPKVCKIPLKKFSALALSGKKMNRDTKTQTNPTPGIDMAPCFKVKASPHFLSSEQNNEIVRNKLLILCLSVRNKAPNYQYFNKGFFCLGIDFETLKMNTLWMIAASCLRCAEVGEEFWIF